MTVVATERFFTPMTLAPGVWDGYGETTTVRGPGGTDGWTLACYLTAPLPTHSRVHFVVLAHEEADEYWWTFQHPPTKMVIHQTTGEGVANVTLAGTGPLQTDVVVRRSSASVATLSLTQTAAAPSLTFETLEAEQLSAGAGADMVFALREICEELKPYIDAAAAATGPTGIPARLLAAVLFMEAWARPKDGSPKADLYRKRLEGTTVNPRWDAIKEKLDRWTGGSPMKLHLHDIRDEELDLIRGYYNAAASGDPTWAFVGKKTLGVGQIAQTTAAMAGGLIAWRDLGEATRSTDLGLISDDYDALGASDKVGIFNALRFPKTNIVTAAKLLTLLKNRTHRFPAMSPKDVVTSGRAVEVLATEYNRGGFDTPLASVKANGNGLRARKYVLAPSSIGLDRFFPDPP